MFSVVGVLGAVRDERYMIQSDRTHAHTHTHTDTHTNTCSIDRSGIDISRRKGKVSCGLFAGRLYLLLLLLLLLFFLLLTSSFPP